MSCACVDKGRKTTIGWYPTAMDAANARRRFLGSERRMDRDEHEEREEHEEHEDRAGKMPKLE